MVEIREGEAEGAEDRLMAILRRAAVAAGHPLSSASVTFEAWDGETYLGGLIARVGVDWLCIDLLAVEDAARGRGVGRDLMVRAEAFARERGMTGVWLDTFTFQAPGFYAALGYQEVGRIEDYPRDQARIFYAKRFADVPAVRRVRLGDDVAPLLALIRESFAFMDGRVDPPSSMHRLTEPSVEEQAREGEVWVLVQDDAPVACVFLTPQADALYLGKLAVAEGWRGRGLARRLVRLAEDRARALGFAVVRLNSRVELVENHAAFAKMGFAQVGTKSHEGFARPTSVTMELAVRA